MVCNFKEVRRYLKYLLLILLTLPVLAVEFSAPVRHGYFKIEINGVIQSENYSTYRKATFAHTQAVIASPEAVIKLIPAWYEDIKVTGIDPPTEPEPPTDPHVYGEVTLTWTAPIENTDDSTLTDLAGFKVYYGLSVDDLSTMVSVTDTKLTLTDLGPHTYYFAVAAVNDLGIESELSNIVKKKVL